MGLTSAKSTSEEQFICCFPSSFLTSSFSAALCSLLFSASVLLSRSLDQAGMLWLITQMLPNYSDMFSERCLRQDRLSCSGFLLYLKMGSLVISWQRINEVWRGTWISSFLKKSFSRRCTALRKWKEKLLTGELWAKAEFSQYSSRDVKKENFFLVHQWKDLLYFNLSFSFENNETTLLFPCLQGVVVLPKCFQMYTLEARVCTSPVAAKPSLPSVFIWEQRLDLK